MVFDALDVARRGAGQREPAGKGEQGAEDRKAPLLWRMSAALAAEAAWDLDPREVSGQSRDTVSEQLSKLCSGDCVTCQHQQPLLRLNWCAQGGESFGIAAWL